MIRARMGGYRGSTKLAGLFKSQARRDVSMGGQNDQPASLEAFIPPARLQLGSNDQ
jgi:hypothetical protein